MKILDRYIFLNFVKTFFSVFIILMFIFLLQSIWLYISDLAGKDLDWVVIGKLLFYVSPKLIPMVLPLTILVASLMTFGSFAEHYEFAAMKASGISLQRAMKSLIVFVGLLGVVTFYFANNVIPWSEFKSINLRHNIKKLKPALALVEGSFNQIGDYNIKVEKKTGENGQYLHNVIIHKTMPRNRGMIVIKAKSGELVGSLNSNILSLILYDGNQYQRLYSDDYRVRRDRRFIKNNFDEYRFNIDLSSFNDVNLSDDNYSNSASMLDVSELRVALDSLSQKFNQDREAFVSTLLSRNGSKRIMKNKVETPTRENMALSKKFQARGNEKDSIAPIKTIDAFFDSYPLEMKLRTTKIALGSTRGTATIIKGKKINFKKKRMRLNKTEMEIHDKYALAVMCFILFFVGAPLGAIIRKGGIGMPMVVAIFLFLTYYYIGLFAKHSAEDGSISPFIAAWTSTFIMLPLGILLTYRATTDKSFFNPDVIIVPIRKFFVKIGFAKKGKKEN